MNTDNTTTDTNVNQSTDKKKFSWKTWTAIGSAVVAIVGIGAAVYFNTGKPTAA